MTLDVIRVLVRRWYVLVIGLLVTAGLMAGAYYVSPPDYNARGLVLLLPSETSVGAGGNPFLELSGLEQPAGILVAYFASSTAQTEVKEQFPTAQYIVGIDDSTRGPVIAIDVTDKSAESTLSALHFITTRIPSELVRLQAGVDTPAKAAISSMPLSMDSKAKQDNSSTIRLVIAALTVGLLLTGFVAFMLDSTLQNRAARRRLMRKEPPTEGPRGRVSLGRDDEDDPMEDMKLARVSDSAPARFRRGR